MKNVNLIHQVAMRIYGAGNFASHNPVRYCVFDLN